MTRKFRFLDDPRFSAAQSEFESACHCARSYDQQAAAYLAQYGAHGPDISGACRDHFPDDAKDHLRRLARAVTYHSERGHNARPKGARAASVARLAREVATRDGGGFYGPQPLPAGLSDFEQTGRVQRKIDLFQHKPGAPTHWTYRASTNYWRTCRDARAHAAKAWGVPLENVRAQFSV